MTNVLLRAGALSCALLASTCLTAPTMAQTVPPIGRPAPDENGVDVISGRMNAPLRGISVGNGDSSLAYGVGWSDGGYYNLFDTQILFNVSGQLRVLILGRSRAFDPVSANNWASIDGDGETITYNTGNLTYTYTARDGTIITFRKNGATLLVGQAQQITHPDGEVLTFHYLTTPPGGCSGFPCVPVPAKTRVQSVTSNLGYQLTTTYVSDVNTSPDFLKLATVTAINNAVDYCNPVANGCGYTQTWPRLTLAESTSSGTTTRTFTDRLSNVTTVTETSAGVTSLTSPANSAQDFAITYDGSNRVATLTRGGGTWTYTYADALVSGVNQRTTTVAQPLGGNRVYVSNMDIRRVLSATDELGHTTSFQYDAFGRRTRTTAPEGNYTELTYDGRGNVTQVLRRDKAGNSANDIVTSAAYPSTCSNPVTCNLPTSATDANGNVTDYTYDSTHGGVLTATAPAPSGSGTRPETRFGYTSLYAWYKNALGSIVQAASPVYRLTATSTCQTGAAPACVGTADEVLTTIAYGTGSSSSANTLLPVSVSTGAGDASLTATTTRAYDAIGNVTSVDGPLAGTADTTGFRYDDDRHLVMTVSPDPDGAGPLLHRAQQTTYNGDGNVTLVESGTTATLTGAFTATASRERVRIDYDSLGRRATERLLSGPVLSATTHALTQYSYDDKGRLACTAQRMNPAEYSSLPSDACTLDTQGSFGPDRIARTSYDNANRPTLVETGVGTGDEADEVATTYTDNGQTETVTDAEGNRTTYVYDDQDRLSRTRMPDPSTPGTSSTTDYEELTYDDNGNVTNRRLRDGTSIVFSYDHLNRMTLKNLPGSELDVSYTYDLTGRLLTAATSAQTLTFTYDALGRNLTQVGPQGTASYQYDLAGRRARLTYPGAGLYVDYDHLVTGEVTAVRENGASSGVGVLATYAYDDLGRRTSITRGNGTSTSYGYDAVSRLNGLVQDLASTGNDLTLGFSHNPASQIVQNTRSNDNFSFAQANANVTDTINGLNQIVTTGGTSVSHDARGNITAIGANSYGYSSENLLTSAPGSATLGYDPLTRLYQTVGGEVTTRFAYDGVQMIAEYNGSNALQRRYVFGPGVDEPLVWYEGSGTSDRRWFHADERGSVIVVSDASGNLVGSRNTYDEYGNAQGGSITGRFGYTGQAWLPEAGLWYYRARMYSPMLGRFMQTDPVGYDAGWNLYAYVSGDPVNRIDPTGLRNCLQSTSVYDLWTKEGRYLGQVWGPTVSRAIPGCEWGDQKGPGGNEIDGRLFDAQVEISPFGHSFCSGATIGQGNRHSSSEYRIVTGKFVNNPWNEARNDTAMLAALNGVPPWTYIRRERAAAALASPIAVDVGNGWTMFTNPYTHFTVLGQRGLNLRVNRVDGRVSVDIPFGFRLPNGGHLSLPETCLYYKIED